MRVSPWAELFQTFPLVLHSAHVGHVPVVFVLGQVCAVREGGAEFICASVGTSQHTAMQHGTITE